MTQLASQATLSSMLLALLAACVTPEPEHERSPAPLVEAELRDGYPALDQPCAAPIAEPTRLVVTSTDFNTGAVGLVDVEAHAVMADLALASSDAVPVVVDGRVFVINRHGFDYIDELDPDDLSLVHEWSVEAASVDASANPHDLALDPEGRGWVPLHGAGELQRVSFPTLIGAAVTTELALDLSGFADADAIPELSRAIACGDTMFVSAERIDRSTWVPSAQTLLIPVGTAGATPTLFEFDAERPGPDAIELLGFGTGPWRLDAADASGATILLLDSGIERVDLGSGTSEWLVEPAVFEDAGYARLQLSGFDLDEGGRVWVSAASEDFAEFRLLRVDLDGAEPVISVAFSGLESVSGALEIVGHEAWFADTTLGASGLRIFDVSGVDVVEHDDSPLGVGLAPVGLAGLF